MIIVCSLLPTDKKVHYERNLASSTLEFTRHLVLILVFVKINQVYSLSLRFRLWLFCLPKNLFLDNSSVYKSPVSNHAKFSNCAGKTCPRDFICSRDFEPVQDGWWSLGWWDMRKQIVNVCGSIYGSNNNTRKQIVMSLLHSVMAALLVKFQKFCNWRYKF